MIATATVAVLGVGGLLAAPSPTDQKRRVDSRLERTQQRLQAARGKEAVLTSEVAAFSSRIRTVQSRLTPLQERLSALEAEVADLEGRLALLNGRLDREREHLAQAETRLAQTRGALADRLREIYRMGEPDLVNALLQSGSLTEAIETNEMMQRITNRDGDLVTTARDVAQDVRATRDRVKAARDETQASTDRATAAAQEVRTTTRQLQARRAELQRFRDGRQRLLSRVQGDRAQIEAEARDLQRESAALTAKILKAQNPGIPVDSSVSSHGLIYPVQGPLTSGFGYRWGRMHEGIDIAVGTGTPVVAAASGTVITAGWAGGYGNLVVIDHGGGIATAYGHNSRLAVSVGQHVGQGSVIAYSGSTGHSTGPHVHFEVRINGAATNPLAYL